MNTWGLRSDLEKIGDPTGSFLLRNMTTGEVAMRNVASEISEEIDWGTNRELVMKLLFRRAREVGAEVLFGWEVMRTREEDEKVWLVMKDGRRLDADLVLAADGIRSRIRAQILADVKTPIDPIVSDTTLYGVRVEASKIKARSDTKRLMDSDHASVWQGKDGFVVSRYSEKLNSFGGLYGVKSENDMKGLWDEKGDIQFVRDFFAGSCQDLRAALEEATSCDRWKLGEHSLDIFSLSRSSNTDLFSSRTSRLSSMDKQRRQSRLTGRLCPRHGTKCEIQKHSSEDEADISRPPKDSA